MNDLRTAFAIGIALVALSASTTARADRWPHPACEPRRTVVAEVDGGKLITLSMTYEEAHYGRSERVEVLFEPDGESPGERKRLDSFGGSGGTSVSVRWDDGLLHVSTSGYDGVATKSDHRTTLRWDPEPRRLEQVDYEKETEEISGRPGTAGTIETFEKRLDEGDLWGAWNHYTQSFRIEGFDGPTVSRYEYNHPVSHQIFPPLVDHLDALQKDDPRRARALATWIHTFWVSPVRTSDPDSAEMIERVYREVPEHVDSGLTDQDAEAARRAIAALYEMSGVGDEAEAASPAEAAERWRRWIDAGDEPAFLGDLGRQIDRLGAGVELLDPALASIERATARLDEAGRSCRAARTWSQGIILAERLQTDEPNRPFEALKLHGEKKLVLTPRMLQAIPTYARAYTRCHGDHGPIVLSAGPLLRAYLARRADDPEAHRLMAEMIGTGSPRSAQRAVGHLRAYRRLTSAADPDFSPSEQLRESTDPKAFLRLGDRAWPCETDDPTSCTGAIEGDAALGFYRLFLHDAERYGVSVPQRVADRRSGEFLRNIGDHLWAERRYFDAQKAYRRYLEVTDTPREEAPEQLGKRLDASVDCSQPGLRQREAIDP